MPVSDALEMDCNLRKQGENKWRNAHAHAINSEDVLLSKE